MSKHKVVDIMIDVLVNAGVKRCYGIVGDTLNHFTDAIRREGNIQWVHVRHEEAGGFAAGGESYVSGQLSACAGSCGPGSLHFINGLMESHRNRAPVILIATTIPSEENGVAFIQDIDLQAMYGTFAVFCQTLNNPDETRRIMTLAAQAALAKRGAAVVIVPGDVMGTEGHDDRKYSIHLPQPVTRPSDADLRRMADVIGQGKKIAVYGGAGCEHAHDQVVRFCETVKAPCAFTSRAKDFLEPDNPYAIGMTGLLGMKPAYHALLNCDTLVLLGCDFAWRQFYPDGAKTIQIDLDPTHLGRRHPVDIGVVGDVAATLDALQPLLARHDDDAFLSGALGEYEATMKDFARQEEPGRHGLIHPQQVAHLLDKHADADALFTSDAGGAMVWMLRHVKANGRRRTLSTLRHGTMANALPQAMGMAKAFPGRQVISMSGDGGLAMLLGELLTLVQEEIAVKIVIFNNGTLGFVETEMKVDGLLDAYTKLKNPDFAKLAEVVGIRGWKVDRNEDLEAAMTAFLAHPGSAVLDVAVNSTELVMPPAVEAGQAFGSTLYATKAILSGHARDVVELVETNFVR